MAKVTERVILARLNRFSADIIPENQFGFRRGHSTVHAAAKLIHDVRLNFKTAKNTLALYLDMEKAFDSVWHQGLLYKLQHVFHIPLHLVHLLKSYLSDRTFQTKVRTTLSPTKLIRAGVPQGTILAPQLYTLYTADIPRHRFVHKIMYADDAVLYSHSYFAQVAARRTTLHLQTLHEYFKHWKLHINANKSQLQIFTKKFTNNTLHEQITCDNTPIEATTQTKYLGLTLDSRLSFVPQISQAIQKTGVASHRLFPLIARNNKISINNKILIYKQILRPILTYGCPVWHNISDTQYIRLQRTQNKILRHVTNKDRYANINEMHQIAKVQTIRDYVTEAAQKFYTTTIHTSPLTTHLADIRQGHALNPAHKLIHQGLPIYEEPLPPPPP